MGSKGGWLLSLSDYQQSLWFLTLFSCHQQPLKAREPKEQEKYICIYQNTTWYMQVFSLCMNDEVMMIYLASHSQHWTWIEIFIFSRRGSGVLCWSVKWWFCPSLSWPACKICSREHCGVFLFFVWCIGKSEPHVARCIGYVCLRKNNSFAALLWYTYAWSIKVRGFALRELLLWLIAESRSSLCLSLSIYLSIYIYIYMV